MNFKNILPIKVRSVIRRVQYGLFGIDNNFKNMRNHEIYNKIYYEGISGKSEFGEPTSGIGSHFAGIIEPYILEVSKFINHIQPSIIVDLGCGDLAVGKNFVGLCTHYIACDVSSVILDRNKEKFSHLQNIEFRLLDLTTDSLPKGDICFLRQVLQHLSNEDIKKFVCALMRHRPYKYLVLTEHLPLVDNFKPNVDKYSGAKNRLGLNSGLVLHLEPFNLVSKYNFDLLEVIDDDSCIKTTIYKF